MFTRALFFIVIIALVVLVIFFYEEIDFVKKKSSTTNAPPVKATSDKPLVLEPDSVKVHTTRPARFKVAIYNRNQEDTPFYLHLKECLDENSVPVDYLNLKYVPMVIKGNADEVHTVLLEATDVFTGKHTCTIVASEHSNLKTALNDTDSFVGQLFISFVE